MSVPETAVATLPLVGLEAVSKTYRRGPEEVEALRDVRLQLGHGEVVVLLGPSGSGKSTLLNILAGWEQPDTGTVSWGADDREVPARDHPWSDVAIVPQTLGLLEELSVRENVELPLRLRPMAGGGDEKAGGRVDGLLKLLGLDQLADRLPVEVSIGEQQRTGLARALVASPRLLLADEPTGHQDENWFTVVFRTLRLVARKRTTCLVATHHAGAVRFADRVLSIRDGSVEPRPTGNEQPPEG